MENEKKMTTKTLEGEEKDDYSVIGLRIIPKYTQKSMVVFGDGVKKHLGSLRTLKCGSLRKTLRGGRGLGMLYPIHMLDFIRERLSVIVRDGVNICVPAVVSRARANNGKNENLDLDTLAYHFNEATPLGRQLKTKLFNKTGVVFNLFVCRSGNRSSHFDFIVLDENDVSYKVEYKGGNCLGKLRLRENECPWKFGVQYFNGPASSFEVGRYYCRLWHAHYIQSGYLNEEYGLTTKAPNLLDWEKDCFRQGNPMLAWSIEFKSVFRASTGRKSPLELRSKINEMFMERWETDESFRQSLMLEVEEKTNAVFSEKNLWLQLNTVNFSRETSPEAADFMWCAQFPKLRIVDSSKVESKTDIEFSLVFEWVGDCNIDVSVVKARLRWGKGAGFSNLRVDLK